ncbi:hypothetical protein JXD20_00140 [Candidatus Peregrinibacteria bacterium]|nr:hypothetical protein [Candidatus Peregrinibacteria bacterium]
MEKEPLSADRPEQDNTLQELLKMLRSDVPYTRTMAATELALYDRSKVTVALIAAVGKENDTPTKTAMIASIFRHRNAAAQEYQAESEEGQSK